MKIVLIIDVQNDYCEQGTLACKGGVATVRKINQFIDSCQSSPNNKADFIIGTQEWHPKDHISFKISPNGPDEVDVCDIPMKVSDEFGCYTQPLYSKHCVQGTSGAELFNCRYIESLQRDSSAKLNINALDMIFRHGANSEIECDSAVCSNRVNIIKNKAVVEKGYVAYRTGLYHFFNGIRNLQREDNDKLDIYVCGMPTDRNVCATVSDLVEYLFDSDIGESVQIRVLQNLCVGTSVEAHNSALTTLKDWGCIIEDWHEESNADCKYPLWYDDEDDFEALRAEAESQKDLQRLLWERISAIEEFMNQLGHPQISEHVDRWNMLLDRKLVLTEKLGDIATVH